MNAATGTIHDPLQVSRRTLDRAHSVTCTICGTLADEREAITLDDQDTQLEGEAHAGCWEDHNES